LVHQFSVYRFPVVFGGFVRHPSSEIGSIEQLLRSAPGCGRLAVQSGGMLTDDAALNTAFALLCTRNATVHGVEDPGHLDFLPEPLSARERQPASLKLYIFRGMHTRN